MNTIIMICGDLASAVRLSSSAWLSRLQTAGCYEMAVRVLGCSWFVILSLVVGVKIFVLTKTANIANFGPTGWPVVLSSACLLLFYLALCWLILHRPQPCSRTTGILPSVIAFLGTYLPWAVVLFAPVTASSTQDVVSALLLLTGGVSMVVVIFHLGHSFSIVPQARKLVRTGPYAIVRHPLYFAEEVALLGTLLQFLSPLALALFLAHAMLQVRRMFYEEDVLRRAFADFDGYARTTHRLIPYVW